MIALSALLMVITALPAGSGFSRPTFLSGAETAYNSGVKLMLNKQFEDAKPKFRKAIERDEDFPEAHNNLAYTLRKQGSAKCGVLYVQMNRLNLAEQELEMLVKIDSDLADELR